MRDERVWEAGAVEERGEKERQSYQMQEVRGEERKGLKGLRHRA